MKDAPTYINLHFLIHAIVHDQAMRQAYAMRLHRMARDIGVVANIRVVEIGHPVLLAGIVEHERIKRGKGSHVERLGFAGSRKD